MGEILDLESYRKRRQRRASESAASESAASESAASESATSESGAAGRRRARSGAEAKDHRSGPAIESIESGGEADRAAKTDRDDPKTD